MQSDGPFSNRFAAGLLRYWPWVLAAWLVAAVALRVVPPTWEEIALDGDFDHLPIDEPSVRGERLLEEAFPGRRARSQMLVVVARDEGELDGADRMVAVDVARRLYHRLGVIEYRRALEAGWSPRRDGEGAAEAAFVAAEALREATQAFDRAIELDETFYTYFRDELADARAGPDWPRLAVAYRDRAELRSGIGEVRAAEDDLEAAAQLYRPVVDVPPMAEREPDPLSVAVDLLSPDDPVIGQRLAKSSAALIMLRMDTELASDANVPAFRELQRVLEQVRARSEPLVRPGLRLGLTGSAAIGAETQIAAGGAIRYTELFTVVLILAILALVYRAPLLVAVPVISIGIAVVTSMGLMSWLVLAGRQWAPLGWGLEVFTTSRIFVFVLVFGAGTDFCLFLIARLREEAARRPWPEAVRESLARTSGALVASALTTVVGLGTMWLAEFGKFHHTGPVIAVCLLITLLTCTTFTPSVLRVAGRRVFWPSLPTAAGGSMASFWSRAARAVTAFPALVLLGGWALLLVPASVGWSGRDAVTYDLVKQLSPDAVSRRGTELLERHFPIGDTNPLTVLLVRPEPLGEREFEEAVRRVSRILYLDGVTGVRSQIDPLGTTPPGQRSGLFSVDAWRRRALRNHRISKQYFASEHPKFAGRLARLDVIAEGEPFGSEAAETLRRIRGRLAEEVSHPGSPWYQSQVALAGTTASIQDLRGVTRRDTYRIEISVLVAVLTVLILVLRRVVLSAYLVATVLLSYFAALGLTLLFFRGIGGADFQGLDWKLPLFLFVILVAVGQDYNVYLVTRVFEEQRPGSRRKPALRRALARTGGIITSCGVVMAGTFFSMTAASWAPVLLEWAGLRSAESRPPTLAGITQLGFALGLGVLLDTFYVRPILVPAFIACFDPAGRRRGRPALRRLRRERQEARAVAANPPPEGT